jgi:phosphomevalonate kinase
MIDIQASAPGKVIIAGEYAVLDGAPAICMAVDRRAHVAITSSDNEHHSVLAPGFSELVGRFTSRQGRVDWIEGAADFALLDAVWQELDPGITDNLAIVLDSNEFIDAASSTKIGIGSSAALTVALAAALVLAAGDDQSIHRSAAAAHRRLQGGAGSGVDIACSLAGGIVEFRMGDEAVRALQWPDELHYALLWSGVAADTAGKLDQLSNVDACASRAELVAASARVADIWSDAQPQAIIEELRAYTAVLRRFDIDHELGIFDAGHAALAEQAESSEIVYKPCGAGGGDLGIVIATDAAQITVFVDTAREHNFKHLHMAIDATGLKRDGEQH